MRVTGWKTLTDVSFKRITACCAGKRLWRGQWWKQGDQVGGYCCMPDKRWWSQGRGEKRSESGYILRICRWIRCEGGTKSGVKDFACILAWMTGWMELSLTGVEHPESVANAWRQISGSVLDILSFLCTLDLQEEMLSRQLDTEVCSSVERSGLKIFSFKSWAYRWCLEEITKGQGSIRKEEKRFNGWPLGHSVSWVWDMRRKQQRKVSNRWKKENQDKEVSQQPSEDGLWGGCDKLCQMLRIGQVRWQLKIDCWMQHPGGHWWPWWDLCWWNDGANASLEGAENRMEGKELETRINEDAWRVLLQKKENNMLVVHRGTGVERALFCCFLFVVLPFFIMLTIFVCVVQWHYIHNVQASPPSFFSIALFIL